MTPLDLLRQLHDLGVVLTPYPDGTLRYKAPQAVLTPALLDGMRQHKAELHALVEEWSERASLALYCGELERPEAEALAWQCVLGEGHAMTADTLCNTSPPLCTRCQGNPRVPRQRWCRQCLTESQRARRAERQAAQADDPAEAVTQAEIQAMPCVTQGDTQTSAAAIPNAEQGLTDVLQAPLSPGVAQTVRASAGVTQAQRQVLLAYRTAVQEYEARRQIDRGWMPMDRSTMLVPLWQKVEEAKRRCLVLGVDPERDRR